MIDGTGTSNSIQIPDHDQDMSNELANDLEQLLQNPTLRKALEEKGSSLDLQTYAATIESELEELEETCIAVYKSKSSEIHELRHNLLQSSQILQMVYEMLITFQNNIGNLSIDIRQLQTQLQMIDVQLYNRKSTVQQLRDYLQHIIIAPTVINTIMYDPVNTTQYIQAVQEIQQLYTNCSYTTATSWSYQVPIPSTKSAGTEMKQELIQLQNIASQRIREYFLQQLTALQRPTNIRFVQVHNLLKYSSLYDFLEDYYDTGIQHHCPWNATTITNASQSNSDSSSNVTDVAVVAASSSIKNDNIANEIYNVYIEIMSNILKQLFRTYSQQLLLLDYTKYHCTKNDVIAIDASTLRESVTAMMSSNTSGNSTSSTTPSHSHNNKSQYQKLKRMDPFSLNTRAMDVLGEPPSPHSSNTTTTTATMPPLPLPTRINVHISILQQEQYPYERLYGSLLGHLLDAVTNEHIFTRQFFKRTSTGTGSNSGQKNHHADDTFTDLFGHTISLLLEQIENYLFTCYDTICLLLMIHITHSIRSMARHRKIYVLENFLDQLVHLLWPRLKIVMDHHYRSIQNATSVSLEVTDAHTASHYVSRRFGEFCCSILLIMHHSSSHHQHQLGINDTGSTNSPKQKQAHSRHPSSPISKNKGGHHIFGKGQQHHDDTHPQHHQSAGSKLLQDVSDMIDAYIQLLERVSEVHTTQKKRIVFLINNLDQVVCIFQERRVTGKECNKILEHLLKYREDYVEEELLTGFSKMIAFVQQTEAHMASVAAASARSDTNTSDRNHSQVDYDVNPSVVESLVLDFASNWKTSIDQINRNVLSYFSNFRNGMEILKHCLTQLLLYYTRFQDIIRKVWKKSLPPFTKDLVSTNAILAEIKRYALAI